METGPAATLGGTRSVIHAARTIAGVVVMRTILKVVLVFGLCLTCVEPAHGQRRGGGGGRGGGYGGGGRGGGYGGGRAGYGGGRGGYGGSMGRPGGGMTSPMSRPGGSGLGGAGAGYRPGG